MQLNILRHDDFYEVDRHGNTPFHHAFKNEDYDIVELLLEYSSKYKFSSVFYISNKDGLAPLDYAIGKGHKDIVNLALQTDDLVLNKSNQSNESNQLNQSNELNESNKSNESNKELNESNESDDLGQINDEGQLQLAYLHKRNQYEWIKFFYGSSKAKVLLMQEWKCQEC